MTIKTVPAREVVVGVRRTRTVNERARVTLVIPVHIAENPDELYVWVDHLKYTDPAQHRKLENAYEEVGDTADLRSVDVLPD